METIDEINALIKEKVNKEEISAKDINDGHHTFRELYRHKMVLFCTICNLFPEFSWKSKKHFDNENDPMFDGDFIAGINTPNGVASYHFKLEHWDLFEIPEIENAPKYDFDSGEEVLKRVASLSKLRYPSSKK